MKVRANMGTADKLIRIFLAIVMTMLYFTQIVSGALGIALIALSVVFVFTSFISFCPLYLPFHISTKKKREPESK